MASDEGHGMREAKRSGVGERSIRRWHGRDDGMKTSSQGWSQVQT